MSTSDGSRMRPQYHLESHCHQCYDKHLIVKTHVTVKLAGGLPRKPASVPSLQNYRKVLFWLWSDSSACSVCSLHHTISTCRLTMKPSLFIGTFTRSSNTFHDALQPNRWKKKTCLSTRVWPLREQRCRGGPCWCTSSPQPITLLCCEAPRHFEAPTVWPILMLFSNSKRPWFINRSSWDATNCLFLKLEM